MNHIIRSMPVLSGVLILLLAAIIWMPSVEAAGIQINDSLLKQSDPAGREGDRDIPATRESGELIVPVTFPEAEDCPIVQHDGGQLINAGGHGYLSVPGKPMLPAKNLLVLLPPGARVQSVLVEGSGARQLPGTFQILPAPPIRLLDTCPEANKRLQKEWLENNQQAYLSNQAYPGVRGELKGSGTLRKYAYASISVYPFSYSPLDGRLIHYSAAQIVIHYETPTAGSPEAREVKERLRDTVADAQAARLFMNYADLETLYAPPAPPEGGLMERHDFVILTPLSLLDTVYYSDFVAWKKQLGYDIVFVLIDDSKKEDREDRDLAGQIRNFLRTYYLQWGTRYVLIVGDTATIPMRYCYPDPNYHYHNPGDPWNPGGSIPTDYFYADLSYPEADSWDSDGDGFPGEYLQDNPDFLAEVFVGRIPTSDPARVAYALNKLVSFEQDTGNWKNRAIHAGSIVFYANQDHGTYPVVDTARVMNAIENDFMSGWAVNCFSEQAGLAPSVYAWPALTEYQFISNWRDGRFSVVNWGGHGIAWGVSRTVWQWDDGDGVPESHDPDELTEPRMIGIGSNLDDDYPSIVFAVSCNVGYPEPTSEGNLGIDLLTDPGCGAAAGIVSATRGAAVAVDWLNSPGGSESILYEFNHHMINGPAGPESLGQALYEAKFFCHSNYAWDHRLEFQNLYVYNLYGDPTMHREGISNQLEPNLQVGGR